MPRTIDADALEREFMAMTDDELCEDCCYNVVNKLSAVPTVDAVPVVRCVDCECFRPTGTNLNGYWFCQSWDMDMLEEATDPKRFYCADGKVKTYGEGQV